MRPDDIIGYAYLAETLCPACTVEAVVRHAGRPLDVATAEAMLDVLAAREGITRTDEHTFDSDDFPKVIFAEEPESCGTCWHDLI